MHRLLTAHVQLGIPALDADRLTNLDDHAFGRYPTNRHSHLSFEWSSWLPPYRTRLRITPCSGDHAPTLLPLGSEVFSIPHGTYHQSFIHSITALSFIPQDSDSEGFQASGLTSSLARARSHSDRVISDTLACL